MCYTRRKTEGGEGALWESDDANFLNPNGQSRNLNIYMYGHILAFVGRTQHTWPIDSLFPE